MTYISQTAPLHQTRITKTLSTLIEVALAMFRKYNDRRVTQTSLEKLSDKYLRDVGLTRNDVSPIKCNRLPSNAALSLSEISKSRACNW